MNKFYSTLLILFFLVISLILPVGPSTALAAQDQDLVRVGSGPLYLIEGTTKRKIKDADTLNNLCWSGIKQISKAELASHPNGANFSRVIRYAGNVFVLSGCQKRYVRTLAALDWNGFSTKDIRDINTSTFNHWSEGQELTAPKLMQSPGNSTVYFIDSGVRRAIKDSATFGHWRFNSGSIVVSKKVLQFPKGANLTRLVMFNGNVYAVDCGTFRYAGDINHMKLNGYDPADLVAVGADAANYLSIGANLSIPRVIKDESTGIKYLVDNNELRKITSDYAYGEWGLSNGDITKVPKLVGGLQSVSTLNLLARDAGGTYWLAWHGSRRRVPDSETFNDYGFTSSDVSAASHEFLRSIFEGSALDRGTDSLEGNKLPNTSGTTAREQHLYLTEEEYNLGRDSSTSQHYSRSGTPSESQNGMAGGFGAFGSAADPPSVDQERYYINMRWNYVSWYEDCGDRDSSGHCTTHTRNLDYANKGWHRHKRVIVKNPANGRRLVASIEESGPAIWTGRVSGLSPEAMAELGASTNDNLEYAWAANQNLPLGRLY